MADEGYVINICRRWLYLRDGEPRSYSVYEVWYDDEFIQGFPTLRAAEEHMQHLNAAVKRSKSKLSKTQGAGL